MKFNKVQDSGKRQQFNTGSQRDTDEGKGQPHLLPFETINLIESLLNHKLQKFDYRTYELELGLKVLSNRLYEYGEIRENEASLILLEAIEEIIYLITYQEKGHYTEAYRRLAIHYQNGAKKYDKNNWKKGQPISRYYDSTIRHLWKIQAKLNDEDHYAALLWNLVAIVQTKQDIKNGHLSKELNDFPFTINDIWTKK